MTSAAEVWASPEWYPVGIDRRSRRLQFVRMSPETYRASVFLDSRIRYLGEKFTIGLDDLVRTRGSAEADASRVHYVFHTGFCCSTLLARYFELLPDVLVLKEPGLLSHAALAAYDSPESWSEISTLTLALLTRTYSVNQAICIKASDWCNGLAELVLAATPTATATFQMVSLRRFVLASLKSRHRRHWARARARVARRDAERAGGPANFAVEALTDGQCAAFVWLVNAGICRRLTESVHSSRVAPLDGEDLVARPEPCLNRVIATSRLEASEATVSRLAESSVSKTYSKGERWEFDAEARARELAELDRAVGREADAAVSWAMRVDGGKHSAQSLSLAD